MRPKDPVMTVDEPRPDGPMLGGRGAAPVSASDETACNTNDECTVAEFCRQVRKTPSWPRSWDIFSLL